MDFGDYLPNAISIPNPTLKSWRTAGDVYRHLYHSYSARQDLVQMSQHPRFKSYGVIYADHVLLPCPITLSKPVTAHQIKQKVRWE